MNIEKPGLLVTTHYEGLHDGDLSEIGLQPKLCPSDIWTVGWGHAVVDPVTGKFLTKDTPCGYEMALELFGNMTIAEADALLIQDMAVFCQIINRRLKVVINQNQYDALASYTYNTGGSDTLFKLININAPSDKIYKWITEHYITGKGIKLPGLVSRRKTEAVLYTTGKVVFYN